MKIYNKINVSDIEKSLTFVQLSSAKWKIPEYISINLFEELISKAGNVNLREFVNQDSSDNIDIGNLSTKSNLEVSLDDNYLYIWVKDKWKRIPLSSF